LATVRFIPAKGPSTRRGLEPVRSPPGLLTEGGRATRSDKTMREGLSLRPPASRGWLVENCRAVEAAVAVLGGAQVGREVWVCGRPWISVLDISRPAAPAAGALPDMRQARHIDPSVDLNITCEVLRFPLNKRRRGRRRVRWLVVGVAAVGFLVMMLPHSGASSEILSGVPFIGSMPHTARLQPVPGSAAGNPHHGC
jgi:hypothetical protein